MADKVELLKHFTAFQGCIAFMLNGGLIVYLIIKRLHQRRLTNLMLINMFLSHLVENVVTILYGTVLAINKDTNKTTKRNIINLSTTMAFLSSFCNLPLTGERLIAIKWPFVYQNIQPLHVYIVCFLSWLPPIIFYSFALGYELDAYYGDLLNATIILATMVLLTIANGMIYGVVRMQKLKIANLQVEDLQPSGTNMESINHLESSGVTEESKKERSKKRNVKASYICVGLVIDYVIFWFPTCFLDLLKIRNLATSVVYTGAFINLFFVRFALLNSFFDPIIYISMNKGIRREIKKTLKTVFRC